MPRGSKAHERKLADKTLVVDNGGYSLKTGFVTDEPSEKECHIIPNCLARDRAKRIWVGNQLERCNDFGELSFRRPVEKGFVVNWEAEKAVWNATFLDQGAPLQCDPHDTNLILTEAPNAPSALQTNCDQIVFEEYEFASYSRFVGPSLNAYNNVAALFNDPFTKDRGGASPAECVLLIDSGYSHTTVTPLFHGRPIQQAVRRLDVGGKFLTNYLKELLSIRHYNLVDETYLVNEIKESVSFVSSNFKGDLEKTWKGPSARKRTADDGELSLFVDYVLPDYNSQKKGQVRPHDTSLDAKIRKLGAMKAPGESIEDFMTLGNERFVVPELLFNPRDVGMRQPGIAEMTLQSLSAVPTGLWPAMLANVMVVGGNALIDGFIARLTSEIRQLAPAECPVRLARASNPVKSTWLGGSKLASDRAKLKAVQVSREDYNEHGGLWLSKMFAKTIEK